MEQFKVLEAAVSESSLKESRAVLESLNTFVLQSGGAHNVNLKEAYGICDYELSSCTKALAVITKNFPEFLDKLIDASVYTGGHLRLAGDMS